MDVTAFVGWNSNLLKFRRRPAGRRQIYRLRAIYFVSFIPTE